MQILELFLFFLTNFSFTIFISVPHLTTFYYMKQLHAMKKIEMKTSQAIFKRLIRHYTLLRKNCLLFLLCLFLSSKLGSKTVASVEWPDPYIINSNKRTNSNPSLYSSLHVMHSFSLFVEQANE